MVAPRISRKISCRMAFCGNDLDSQLLKTATACQQNYYEMCSDWNKYQNYEHDYLKDFIGYALYNLPENWENYIRETKPPNGVHFYHFAYKEDQIKVIESIFDKVIELGSGEYLKEIVLCGIIYNVIYNKEEEEKRVSKANEAVEKENKHKVGDKKTSVTKRNEKENRNRYEIGDDNQEPEVQVYPVPIFKVKSFKTKIVKVGNKKMEKPEEIISYIDNSGRVYRGFQDYLDNNTLPPCTMVVPNGGEYQVNPDLCPKLDPRKDNIDGVVTPVWVSVHRSPADKITTKVLQGGDILSSIVSVGALGVGVAAMMTPIGPTVAVGCAVGGGLSGLWSAGRCTQQLIDRGQHGESINLTDRTALTAWVGVAGAVAGVAATGGTALLSRAVRTGTTVGKAAQVAHDAVQIGSLIVNGVGVGVRSYDMVVTIINGENVTPLDVLTLAGHIFFFCNSVVNVKMAQSFIETSQGQILKDYEASLRSNRHRREFQRMARNTRAAGTDSISSNEEIIRGINKISNKDEFFQSMVRNRKAFSASSAKAAFSNGKVVVNSAMTIDPIEFANLPKEVRTDIIRGISSADAPKPAPAKSVSGNVNKQMSLQKFNAKNDTVLKDFCRKHASSIHQAASVKIDNFNAVLGDLKDVTNYIDIFSKLLNIALKIYEALPRHDEVTVGDALASIVQFLWDYIKSNMINSRPYMKINDPMARKLLEDCITTLWFRVDEKLDNWVKAFKKWLKTEFPHRLNDSWGKFN